MNVMSAGTWPHNFVPAHTILSRIPPDAVERALLPPRPGMATPRHND